MPNPIGARELLQALPGLLARTDWPLSQPADAAAALVHTIHIALGFRLIRPAASRPSDDSTGDSQEESHQGQDQAAGTGQDSTSGASEDVDIDDSQTEATYVNPAEGDAGPPPPGRLADDWNAHGEGSYVLEYKHEQSSMEFMIRVGRMGGLVQVDAMAAVRLSSLSDLTRHRGDIWQAQKTSVLRFAR
jgi:hypothetical protein